MSKTVSIWVDGRSIEVSPDANLLQAVLEKGIDLPYFCWHPALGSVGACRQCAVTQFRDENDKTGRVVMACMTPCAGGTRVSLDHPDAKEMRESVVEFLMTNHPHDCPVCEEGGECHLQDMTVMVGHAYRRYRHEKRTHRNQDLGPFVAHEMNRCIACYRCVRFYKDYAGGTDLDVFASANNAYFGRAADGVLESDFAGNLVEVCPTGVFTDKTLGDHYTRKWDLQTAPSVCAHCAIGCNTTPGERYGRLKRITNRYHGELNGYFLCDRGRYGYQFVNDAARPRVPLARTGHTAGSDALETGQAPHELSMDEAVAQLAQRVRAGQVLGIGSPRASLETNFALRELVGAENFHQGELDAAAALNALGVEILSAGPAGIASIRDAEKADAVLVLGEDLPNTGARLALALRQAVRQKSFEIARKAGVPEWQDASVRILAQEVRSPLYIATPAATGLDEIATRAVRATTTGIARLGQQIVHLLDYTAPRGAGLSEDDEHLAHSIAESLKAAKRPLIVSGTSSGSRAVLEAAGNIAAALAKAGTAPQISIMFAESNSVGTAMLGGPGLDAALERIGRGEVRTLIVAENDLYARVPAARLDAALTHVEQLVVLDAIASPTVQRAQLVLPAGSFAEAEGTLVNFEGRAQRFFQVFMPADAAIQESWRWLQQAASEAGRDLGDTLDPLTERCAASTPVLAGIVKAAPNAKFRVAGNRIPRQTHRSSGRTAMNANRDIHEPRPPQDRDSPFAFSMEGARHGMPSSEIPVVWWPKWNSNQAVGKFQAEINGALKGGDPGVLLLHPDRACRIGYHERSAMIEADGLHAVPLYHLFGSEPLSALGPAIRTRIAAAYVALSRDTAGRLQLTEGASVDVDVDGQALRLPLRVLAELPDETVGLPVGLAGVGAFAPGAAVSLRKSAA